MAKKYYIGFLILVILTASVYIYLPNKIRVDVSKTRTQFKVFEEDKLVLAATGYVNLFDGSKKMRAKERKVNSVNRSGIIFIYRSADYKDEISVYETYIFDSTKKDIELIPVSHEIICYNCKGKILHFEYRDILYDGETKEITSPFSFGHKMKLEWQEGSYLSKVYQQKYASDKIIIRYRPESDYEIFNVRLFDPIKKAKETCKPVYRKKQIEVDCIKNGTADKCKRDVLKKDGCIKTGEVNISGKVFSIPDSYCKIIKEELCCIPNKEGGKFGAWERNDGSTSKICIGVDDLE